MTWTSASGVFENEFPLLFTLFLDLYDCERFEAEQASVRGSPVGKLLKKRISVWASGTTFQEGVEAVCELGARLDPW